MRFQPPCRVSAVLRACTVHTASTSFRHSSCWLKPALVSDVYSFQKVGGPLWSHCKYRGGYGRNSFYFISKLIHTRFITDYFLQHRCSKESFLKAHPSDRLTPSCTVHGEYKQGRPPPLTAMTQPSPTPFLPSLPVLSLPLSPPLPFLLIFLCFRSRLTLT